MLPASVKSLLRVLREGGWDASTRHLTVNAAAAPSHDEWLSVILEMFDEGMINVGFSGGRPIEVCRDLGSGAPGSHTTIERF